MSEWNLDLDSRMNYRERANGGVGVDETIMVTEF